MAKEKEVAALKEKEVAALKEKEVAFVNPFDKGVSYEIFLKAIPTNSNIEKYCEKHLEKDQVDWLKNEIEILKNK